MTDEKNIRSSVNDSANVPKMEGVRIKSANVPAMEAVRTTGGNNTSKSPKGDSSSKK